MKQDAPYRFVVGFYSLFLGIWIGAMVMLAVSAAITFRTARQVPITINEHPYDQSFLAGKQSEVLAGEIVGNIIEGLAVVQAVCLVVVALTLVLQCTAFRARLVGGVTGKNNFIRIALIVIAIFVFGVERSFLTPTIHAQRAIMYNATISPESRDDARTIFQHYHRLSEQLVGASMLLLFGAAILSPFVLYREDHEENQAQSLPKASTKAV